MDEVQGIKYNKYVCQHTNEEVSRWLFHKSNFCLLAVGVLVCTLNRLPGLPVTPQTLNSMMNFFIIGLSLSYLESCSLFLVK
jgi:hypothetical protein